MTDYNLSKQEQFLLEWLSREETSAYGECRGQPLDRLQELGLAQVGDLPAGRTDDNYRRVWLTEKGIDLASKQR